MQKEILYTMMTFEEYLAGDSRKLSDDQLKVVYSNVATIVSAGAGSGKTTVLSYRYLRLLMEQRAHVDQILTLTFTRKAASEMYERIFRLVEKVSEHNDILKEESRNFASSTISTLDSFASEIARTDCARYGISRNFQIIDKEDEEDLFRRIAFTFLDNADEDVMNLSRFFSPAQFWELFADVASRFNILTSSDEVEYEEGYRAFLQDMEASILAEIEHLMMEVGEYDGPGLVAKDFFNPSSEFYYRTVASAAKRGLGDQLPEKFNLRACTGKLLAKDQWQELKDIFNTYKELRSLLYVVDDNLAATDMAHSVAKVFSSFVRHLQSQKRRMGVLCFSDVEALALEILKNNRDVRSFYKKKFKFIMIDEFQDNSRRQRDLLFILSEREDLDGVGVPEKEDLDKTKLFFVGDDKQSIYLFRNADVAVFNALKDDIVAIGGKHLTMGTNYRSNPELLRHFNNVFKSILDGEKPHDLNERFEESMMEKLLGRDDLGGYEAIFEPIGGADNPDRCRSRVVFSKSMDPAKLDEDTVLVGKLGKEENEAEHILKLVRTMTETDEYLIPNRDGSLRRPGYDDIAVLFQKSASQMPLEKTFRREGLPYTVVSSTSITLEAVSADFIAFLKLVLYPGDKVSYFQVLRSPFVRLSDRALKFYTRYRDEYVLPEGERAFEYIPDELDESDRERLEQGAMLYRKVVGLAGRAPLTVILDTLYYEGGYSAFLKSSLALYPYEEHFQYLWETARGMDTLVEFVSHMEDRMANVSKFDVDILRLKTTGVKMMTIHKSKGLEFPIVILAGSGSWRSRNDTSRVVTYEGAPFIALDSAGESGINRLFRAWKNRRLLAEKKRLLYVALTRAETHLVVVATGEYTEKKGYYYNEKSMAYLYERGLEDDTIHIDREFPILCESDIDRKSEKVSEFPAFYDRPVAERGTFTRHKYGAKELAHIERDSGVEVESEKGEYIPGMNAEVERLILSNGLSPDYGTYVHALFEAHFNGDSSPSFSSEKLTSKQNEMVSDEGRRMEGEFYNTELYRKYVSSALTVVPEEGFVALDGDVVIEGSIDLLLLGKDYNMVIDYKTDRYLQPKDHEGQMKSYIEAVENLYPGKPCYAVLYYVRDHHSEKAMDRDGNTVDLK